MQYGKDIVSTGPVFASIITDAAAGTATVSYKRGTASGLHHAGTANCDLVGSKLCCGESPVTVLLSIGTWQRANYTITGARAGTGAEPQVVVTLPADVASPLAVRYTYEAWPQCSFYNGRGGPDDHAGIAANPWCWNHTTPCPY